ncbi:hypothetical protein C2E20_3340 [Micractinium conductrix]|uniref:Glycosyltransferase family 92 protein n=1 Tax=Micractinium conductrix TaxID=554055 RepID=A0A2P6VGK5_9CHLO|nr:hypothetical protein C2E20_3340 [Micractinium conductrix]|eukprot:PSC73229.1 hypothetical protein C2E20_3340 [Micractinium conductrix]
MDSKRGGAARRGGRPVAAVAGGALLLLLLALEVVPSLRRSVLSRSGGDAEHVAEPRTLDELLLGTPLDTSAADARAAERQRQWQQEQQERRQERKQQPTRKAAAYEAAPKGEDNAEVAICVVSKNDHCDLREWVLYHASVGVRKFYLFDTGSKPPLTTVLDDAVASGLVEFHYLEADAEQLADRKATVSMAAASSAGELSVELVPPEEGKGRNWQVPVFSACLNHFGKRHKWMGFIDTDEFVLLQQGVPSVPALLERYADYGGLVLHWRVYGTGPHILRPDGGVLASYTVCCAKHARERYHRQIKSFVQPARTLYPEVGWVFTKGYWAVDTELNRVDRLAGPNITWEGAALAHYLTRSLVDFLGKQARGGGSGGQRTFERYFDVAGACLETCDAAVPLGRALNARYDLSHGVPERCRTWSEVVARGKPGAIEPWLLQLEQAD